MVRTIEKGFSRACGEITIIHMKYCWGLLLTSVSRVPTDMDETKCLIRVPHKPGTVCGANLQS